MSGISCDSLFRFCGDMTDIVAAGVVVQRGTVWPDRVADMQASMSLQGNRIAQNCVEVIRERSIDKQSARVILGGMNV